MGRIYLYVAPEESVAVAGRGALWDAHSKRWYLTTHHRAADFGRWLNPCSARPAALRLRSTRACIAECEIGCSRCHGATAVISIYCESGHCDEQPLGPFCVAHIYAIGEALARQLEGWKFFHCDRGVWRNHCVHCQAPQCDVDLHCEPTGPFFHMDGSACRGLKMTPLSGAIDLDGEEILVL